MSTSWPLNVWIPGKPAKQGSKRVVPHVRKMRAEGKVQRLYGEDWIPLSLVSNRKYVLVLDDDKNNVKWRKHVASHFSPISELLDEPVFVIATFYRVRPKTHLNTKGLPNKEGLKHPKPDTQPDSFKMMRSVEDALSGVVWKDDARITDHVIRKRWGDEEGVHLLIWPDRECPVEVVIR